MTRVELAPQRVRVPLIAPRPRDRPSNQLRCQFDRAKQATRTSGTSSSRDIMNVAVSATTHAKPYQSPSSSKPQHSPDGISEEPERDGDEEGNWSGEESGQDQDGGGGGDSSKKRKRPMSVSCELCKQRKVKCDRGQPSCGWCSRNNQYCEYRERKKPGLRAGYGRELEARLGWCTTTSSSKRSKRTDRHHSLNQIAWKVFCNSRPTSLINSVVRCL